MFSRLFITLTIISQLYKLPLFLLKRKENANYATSRLKEKRSKKNQSPLIPYNEKLNTPIITTTTTRNELPKNNKFFFSEFSTRLLPRRSFVKLFKLGTSIGILTYAYAFTRFNRASANFRIFFFFFICYENFNFQLLFSRPRPVNFSFIFSRFFFCVLISKTQLQLRV